MAIKFPRNPSNGDTVTKNSVIYTYQSSNNRWSPSIGVADDAGLDSAEVLDLVGSGLTTYSSLDSLPSSGLSLGDQAFISSARRLYVSDGSGWYSVAVANAAPRWDSAPQSTYEIVDSATPLVITAKAVDSDNPYSHLTNQSFASDSAQYMVDITIDSSVFTFTPKSADSIGQEVAAGNLTDSNGDFTYTFKWTDGVSVVSSPAIITYNVAGGSSDIFAAIRISSGSTGQAYNLTQDYPNLSIVSDPTATAYPTNAQFIASNTSSSNAWNHNQFNHDAVKFVAADDIYILGYLALPQSPSGTWVSKNGAMIQTGSSSYVTGGSATMSGSYPNNPNGWTYYGIDQSGGVFISAGTSMNVFLMNFGNNGTSLRTAYSYNSSISAPTGGTSFTISNVDSTTSSSNGTSATAGYVAGIVYKMA